MLPFASDRGHMPRPDASRRALHAALRQSVCVAALVIGLSNPAWAGGPTGGTIAAGSAAISNPGADSTLITQTSQSAIINWQNFSIPKSANVTFAQPNPSAITLNRVTGPTQSIIDGTLAANGRVWIVNRNGVMFGAGSAVNVGALIATTSDIADGDFLAGNYAFSKASDNHDAAIVNNGTIHAANGGSVVLAGPVVENNGLIQADLGSITLASGEAFTVDFQGDNLIRFAVTTPVSQTPKNDDGTPKKALVSNSGKLAAAGGRIVLTARAARAVADNVMNSTGIVEASSVHTEGGVIVFDAGPDGTANVSGRVDASGTTGGSVSITGKSVTIGDDAHIDASGATGGGKIAIGGDLRGAGPTANAQSTAIGKATLNADAKDSGDGGTISVWSDGSTQFAGSASARGGANGGDGGLVETSGHDLQVAADARVDTHAPQGATGTWLLDPENITIKSGAEGGIGSSNLSGHTIETALSSSNVTLETAGDIEVRDGITYTSTNALSLLAGGDLYVAANVQNAGTGAITAIAGWDGVTTDPSLLTGTGKFGNNNGSVYVTSDYDLDPGEDHNTEVNEGEVAPVAIGSKGGQTTIAGSDVQVLGYFDRSQIGYHGEDAIGNITVTATGAIVLTASTDGACTYCYAQIGHGGVQIQGNQSGDIHVTAGGAIDLSAGGSVYSYAQIGNGGDSSDGNYSGDISLNAGSNVTLTGAGDYAQIGNGGWGGSGAASGAITAQIAGNLSLTGGSSSQYGYAQIGQGGQSSSGAYSGDIAVTVDGNLSMIAGGQNSTTHNYVQIGNGTVTNLGGNNAQRAASGVIALTIGGASTLTSRASGNDAWIGNINGTGASSGGALSFVTGTLDISGDATNDFPAMLVSGLSGGDVTLGVSAGAFDLRNSLTYSSDHVLSLLASGDIGLNASLQNSGSGAINIVAGWNGTTRDATHFSDDNVYANGGGSVTIGGANAAGDVAVGSASGAILLAGQNITLNTANGYAQAGYHGANGGNITLKAKGGVTLSGTSSARTAQIGNGSTFNSSAAGGAIALSAATLAASANYSGIAGNSAAITLSGASTLGSSAQPLKIAVNSLSVTTAGTNAFIASPDQGLSLAAINVGAGSFNLSAGGAVTQSAGLAANAVSISTTSGAINLTNATNSFGTLAVTTANSDNASIAVTTAVTIAASTIGGTLSLTAGGAITQSGAITTATLNVASTNGAVTLSNVGNSFGSLVVTASGSNDATLFDSSAVALGTSNVGGKFKLTSDGAITQTGAVTAATLNVASTSGGVTLTNAGNSFANLSVTTSGANDATLSDSSAVVLGISSIGGTLTLTSAGAITQSGAITAATLNVASTGGAVSLTHAGNSFANLSVTTSGTNNATIADTGAVALAASNVGGTFKLTSGGTITQTGALTAATLNVTSTGGAITLTTVGNSFANLSVTTSGANNATIADTGAVALAASNVGGTFKLTSGGVITQTGALTAAVLNVTAAGNISLIDAANVIGQLALNAGNNSASVYDSTSLAVNSLTANGGLTLLSTGSLTFNSAVQIASGALTAVAGWDGTTTSATAPSVSTAFGNNGGNVVIGGSNATGGVAVGASGIAILAGANVTLSAVNGYAQFGTHGTGTGSLAVAAKNSISLNGGGSAGYYAQIGHGGAGLAGSNAGTITIAAGGDLNLTGGSAANTYAQIGHGGGTGNANSTGYSETGTITATATNANLKAGGGKGAYAQIGHGGYLIGKGLSGTATLGGDVSVTTGHTVNVNGGGGDDAYAQIGNGGDQANSNPAASARGTTSGTVTVIAPNGAAGAANLVAGLGANAYAQVGNGGYGMNAFGAGVPGNFTISGNVTLTDLLLQGGNGGANAYSQVGNGDASKTAIGGISGDIHIDTGGGPITIVPGTAANSGGSIGNATGKGTISGAIAGYTPPSTVNNGVIATLTDTGTKTPSMNSASDIQNLFVVIDDNRAQGEVVTLTGNSASQTTPLEDLMGDGNEKKAESKSDKVADAVGNSLDGSKKKAGTEIFLGGMLRRVVPMPPSSRPRGVPPADADYSSWGNEAFWQ